MDCQGETRFNAEINEARVRLGSGRGEGDVDQYAECKFGRLRCWPLAIHSDPRFEPKGFAYSTATNTCMNDQQELCGSRWAQS